MDKIFGMQRNGADPRVRKTLVRNSEQPLTSPDRRTYARAETPSTSTGPRPPAIAMGDMRAGFGASFNDIPSKSGGSAVVRTRGDSRANFTQEEKHFHEPKLCSSLSLHEYIEQLKSTPPEPLEPADVRKNANLISKRVTKQLNFPFDEAIYKNLIELDGADPTTSHQNKLPRRFMRKRDLEPKEEDFFLDEEVENLELVLPRTMLESEAIVVKGDVGLYERMKPFEGDCFPEAEVEGLELVLPRPMLKSKAIVVKGDVGLYELMRPFEGDPL